MIFSGREQKFGGGGIFPGAGGMSKVLAGGETPPIPPVAKTL